MKRKLLLTSMVIFFGVLTELQATPIFASQYDMRCNSCHSMIPTLNKTGLQFLRNGFRFSSVDKTLASAFIDANSSKSRISPIRGLIGVNIDTENREDTEKVNLYFGGSMTDTLSLYAVTKSTYNKKKDHNLFEESNSKAFTQWNPDGNKHVFKVGWMNPLTMFSNTDRVSKDNGLMGSGSKNGAKQKGKNATQKGNGRDSNNHPSETSRGNSTAQHSGNSKLPVLYADVGLVKGAEYSYLYDDKVLILVNYGIPSSSPYADDDTDTVLTAGVELKDIGGYAIGAIYSHKELGDIESDSYIVPIEKEVFGGQLMFQQSFVYKDSNQYENPYYGSQTTAIYQINDESQARIIVSLDKDEKKETSSGYSLTYSKSWNDSYLIHLTGARQENEVSDENIAKLSIYKFF